MSLLLVFGPLAVALLIVILVLMVMKRRALTSLYISFQAVGFAIKASQDDLKRDLVSLKKETDSLHGKLAQLHEKVEPPKPDPVNMKAYQTCFGQIIELRSTLQTKHPEIDDEEFVQILNRAVYDLLNGTNLNG